MTQQVPFAWRLFNLLGHQRGLLYGSVALVVLVAAYRVMTHRPLVGGVFEFALGLDRKSTRPNSSHSQISYAVFCLKKKKNNKLNINKILMDHYLRSLML